MIKNQIIEILSNNSNCQAKVESLLNLKELPSKFLVKFCLEVNKPLDELYDVKENSKVYQARQNCLRLTESWLANPNSVSEKGLEAASEAARAAGAVYWAAGAVYWAAGAAEAVYWAAGAAGAAYCAAEAGFSYEQSYKILVNLLCKEYSLNKELLVRLYL